MVKQPSKYNTPKSKTKLPGKWHAVPLKGSFMLTAMLGFLISVYWVYPNNKSYVFTFLLVFAAMFVASLISMTKAPIVEKMR